MKKIVSAFVSVALVGSASMAVPTTMASAQGASELVRLCKEFGEAVGYTSVGDCVGTIRSNAPRTCKALQDIPGAYEFFGFRNRGDCVSFIRALQNG